MNKEGLIYESSREHMLKSLAELKKLQDDGISFGTLEEEVWEDIVELIKSEDEEKLEELRKELVLEKERLNKMREDLNNLGYSK